ncbi:MAG: glycosyltransferase family 2 protein [Candidatus Omnitrophica bacterium]|nr:glycosyltransferase family 2 protein [Candidatus Omnitrophota bacterium]
MNQLYSIIICTCNRSDLVIEALKTVSLLKTDGSFSYEVIVIDNSAQGTIKPSVDSVVSYFKNNILYSHEPQRGKSFALNHGLTLAKGDVVAFTDDDVVVPEDWLIQLNAKFDKYNCDGIGGRVLPIYPDNTPQWIKDNAVKLAGGVVIYDYGEGDFSYTPKSDYFPFIGANFAFKRSVFDTCGPFRVDLGPGTPVIVGEDTEMVERLAYHGKTLYYCGKVLIRHPVDLNRLRLKHMAKWHIALGRYAAKREIENKVKISSYFFGIPRYLYKGIVFDGIKLLFSWYNQMLFLNAWRAFFRKVGLMKEYRLQRGKST